jgi:hypothetical protein
MFGFRFATVVHAVRRAIFALGLAAPILFSLFASIAPASAATPDPRDPVARIQVVIKKVHIRDDNDWFSEGEMSMEARIWRCAGTTKDSCLVRQARNTSVDGFNLLRFDRSSGDAITLDRSLPDQGFAVFPGELFMLYTRIIELDARGDQSAHHDEMGEIFWTFGAEDGWRLGAYTVRAFDEEAYEPGDYDVEFEVRQVPLPDFAARTTRLINDGGQQFRCVDVANVGAASSGLFTVTIRVDERPLRTVTMPALRVGDSAEHCVVLSELPPDRQSLLSFVVDDGRLVAEMDEMNNRIDLAVDRTTAGSVRPQVGPGPGVVSAEPGTGAGSGTNPPTPSSTPTPALPDLTIGELRINGQVPDKKDDCKDGKNDVTVVVKNGGTANAGPFAVQLVVDGNSAHAVDTLVPGLDAGKESEVRFDKVRIRQGERVLAATADVKEAVAESNEGNNTRTVTARCKDGA